ncbi:hypothetical protein PHO31112_04333 [Pandoraea horticolens]|uniref:Uncharacterized protein n=1 Tax=Pandoraea horticolens TaxID=2508298 RepID=A0A5E4Y7Z8_9BURK|nr:hypothetical protein PHO31112_04333 [Pandoraea horticolens]
MREIQRKASQHSPSPATARLFFLPLRQNKVLSDTLFGRSFTP